MKRNEKMWLMVLGMAYRAHGWFLEKRARLAKTARSRKERTK